jgi:hypothetical protein
MYTSIIQSLNRNKDVFKELLQEVAQQEYLWSQEPSKWSLLEIVCHIRDEEVDDFRTRVKYVLEDPLQALPSIDPVGWVKKRKYIEQDYDSVLDNFIYEREQSVKWLSSLKNPKWNNSYLHPKLGPMSAKLFLSNWLAHDLLHIRQIIKLRFDYLKYISSEDLSYAGNW